MFISLLTCSDEDCTELAAFAGSLEAADGVLCDGCGCLMQVVAVEGAEEPPPPAVVVELSAAAARRRRLPALRAAA